MPDHRVITAFTLVKFLLSFAAFTKLSVSVYTRKMFTEVSKLWYLSKPFKSKHGMSYFRSPVTYATAVYTICVFLWLTIMRLLVICKLRYDI